MFNVTQMADAACAAIAAFAKDHGDEHFYAFAVDENLLCLNSEECFAERMADYQAGEFGRNYQTPERIADLKANTGDWAYQGFAHFTAAQGFDDEAHEVHYYEASSAGGHAPHTAYAQAMDALVAELLARRAFDGLQRTPDFVATWVDHNY